MPDSPSRQSVTDTPWFWVMLFSLAALAAIATIGPKFQRREQVIETKFHARERGLHREAIDAQPDDAVTEVPEWNPMFTLEPIMAVIGVIAAVSFVAVFRFHRRLIKQVCSAEFPPKPITTANQTQSMTDNGQRTTDN